MSYKKAIIILKSVIFEYGIIWTLMRVIYSFKLRLLRICPYTAFLFEKKAEAVTLDVFDFDLEAIRDFMISLPDDKKKAIIREADLAIEGKLFTFRNSVMDFGNPIRWNYSPITSKSVETGKQWFKIADFNSEIGDTKVVWEPSRFLHFYSFGRAYLLTGDEKYTKAFWSQLKSWMEENRYPMGVNWKCGQEAAIRMVAFLWAYGIFKTSDVTTAYDLNLGKQLVTNCYKKIRSNFFYTYRCIKNNHTISELTGWIIGSYCCNDYAMVRKGYHLLDKVIIQQYKNDGGYIQHSFNYQRLTFQMIACVLSISDKTNMKLNDTSIYRLKNSLDLMYQCQDEITGELPNYGSNDGSLIMPLSCCDYYDYRPTLNSFSVLLNGKSLYKSGIYDEELMWMVPQKKSTVIDEDYKMETSQFRESGYYTLRNESGFCMIRCTEYDSRPAHFDELHVDIWNKGNNIFCDAGTYSYALPEGEHYVSTKSHNTVSCGDREQMKKVSHFMICDWVKNVNTECSGNKFSGSIKFNSGYYHKRTVELKSGLYYINDKIQTSSSDPIIIHWHTPFEAVIRDREVLITKQEETMAAIRIPERYSNDVRISILKDSYSWRSPSYLQKEPTTHFVFEISNNKLGDLYELEYVVECL